MKDPRSSVRDPGRRRPVRRLRTGGKRLALRAGGYQDLQWDFAKFFKIRQTLYFFQDPWNRASHALRFHVEQSQRVSKYFSLGFAYDYTFDGEVGGTSSRTSSAWASTSGWILNTEVFTMADDRITQARWIAVMAITALCVYLCWLMLEPFLYALMWAAVLKIFFEPVHRWLLARTRRPALAAILAVLVVMLAGIVPLSLVGTALVFQLGGDGQHAQNLIKSLLTDPGKNVVLQKVLEYTRRYVDVDQYLTPGGIKSLLASVKPTRPEGNPPLPGRRPGCGGQHLPGAVHLLLPLLGWRNDPAQAAERAAARAKRAENLLDRTRTVISASVNGVLVIAALQGPWAA